MKVVFLILLLFLKTNILSQEKDTLKTFSSGKLFFSLKKNEKIKIDTIIISGNKVTKAEVILKELSFSTKDTITQDLIEYNKQRIYSTALFNKVEDFLYLENNINILELRVHERWFFFPYPVFGIKDRDWKHLYYGLGLAHINFLGLNQKIFGSFALGYDPWINLHYYNPSFFSKNYIFDISLGHSKTKNKSIYTKEKDFYEYWYNAQISLGNRINIYKTLWFSLGYNQIEVTEKNVNKTISNSGKDYFFSFNLSYEINTRDLIEYPMKGEYITGLVKKSGFGESEIDYLQLWIDVRKYIPIKNNSICFRSFSGFSLGNQIPNYSHYFIGYNERVRGNFYKVLEGENITGFSTELRIPIFGPNYYLLEDFPIPQFSILRYGLNFTLFFDAAEVWNKDKFIWKDIDYGWGFGLNFLLPYSVVLRTELAFNNKLKSELIFDVGVSF